MAEEKQPKGHGLLFDNLEPEHYVFGGSVLPREGLQPDGDWSPYLPNFEEQERNGLETYNCTNYGTLNCIETILRRRYDLKIDYSERYTGVMTETSEGGNSPHKVAEVIRSVSGLIEEELLPFSNSVDEWEKYYSPKPMQEDLIKKGKEWLKQYEFGHEWVFNNNLSLNLKQAALMEALTCSPLGVSVYAWEIGDAGLYRKPAGAVDNHWVMLYSYSEGSFWLVFDQYDKGFKKLEWNYDFGMAKRYHVKKKEYQPKRNWLADLFLSLGSFFYDIIFKRQIKWTTTT